MVHWVWFLTTYFLKTSALHSSISLMPRGIRLESMGPRTQKLVSLSLVIQLVELFSGGTLHFLPRLEISFRIPTLGT